MSISANDIKYYLTGATTDGGTQSDPKASLGGYRSSTEITSNVSENVFDNVTGAEASAGSTEYRCIAIRNTHGSLDLTSAIINLIDAVITSGGAGSGNTISFAVEVPATANLTAENGANAQTIASETTAPTSINTINHNGTGSGVSNWATNDTEITLDIGAHDADLGVDEVVFVWFKRVIAAGASAASNIDFIINITGDSAA